MLLTTVLAGFLLGLNVDDRDIKSEYLAWYAKDYASIATWGWPCRYGQAGQLNAITPGWTEGKAAEVLAGYGVSRDAHGNFVFRFVERDYAQSIIINSVVCLSLCLAFMGLCELSIRRALARPRGPDQRLHATPEST
jgi:hypothetical protein